MFCQKFGPSYSINHEGYRLKFEMCVWIAVSNRIDGCWKLFQKHKKFNGMNDTTVGDFIGSLHEIFIHILCHL